MARWNSTTAAVTHPTSVMSISALGTLSSQSTDVGRAVPRGAQRVHRPHGGKASRSGRPRALAAMTDGSRALAAVTSPKGSEQSPIAA